MISIWPRSKPSFKGAIRAIISRKEPRMQVLSVAVNEEGSQQSGISVIVNITYKVADEIGEFSIPLV